MGWVLLLRPCRATTVMETRRCQFYGVAVGVPWGGGRGEGFVERSGCRAWFVFGTGGCERPLVHWEAKDLLSTFPITVDASRWKMLTFSFADLICEFRRQGGGSGVGGGGAC